MATLGDLVDRTILRLQNYSTSKPKLATFNGWIGSPVTGVLLKDVTDTWLQDSYVELETGEVIYILDHDKDNGTTTVPAWFRGQMGTPKNDTLSAGTRAIVNPTWPRYSVAQTVIDGIAACYPKLFNVKEYDFTPTAIGSNYELPADVDQVLKVTREYVGPTDLQVPVGTWSFDAKNTDGKKYLRVLPMHASSGETVRVTYKAAPVVPAPQAFSTDWSTVGLPDSAQDLPVLFAFYTLLPSADAAKLRAGSIAQSDANRYVQAGSTSAISRRAEEVFRERLASEAQKLNAKYPPFPHRTISG